MEDSKSKEQMMKVKELLACKASGSTLCSRIKLQCQKRTGAMERPCTRQHAYQQRRLAGHGPRTIAGCRRVALQQRSVELPHRFGGADEKSRPQRAANPDVSFDRLLVGWGGVIGSTPR